MSYILYVMIPCGILAFIASAKVKSAFARGSKLATQRGWTGAQVARAILESDGIHDVSIEPVQGFLSDHYDPRHKVLRLSPDVYNGRSIAAAGVAAHEVGHAIQHAHGYAPLALRNMVVPAAQFGSNGGLLILMLGALMDFTPVMVIGCAVFSMVVIFQLITLPVEFNASSRARQALRTNGLVSEVEDREIAKVLNAAAMTYVAAAITAVATLLYYLMRSGILGGRSD
jgi:Zn-dependent membrane protease YugP